MGIAEQEVSQQDLADVLGITDRHIRNLKRTVPPSGKRGTALVYRLGPAVQAYLAHALSATVERFTKKDMEEARIRQEIAKATKEEALARSAVVAAKRDEEAVVEIQQVQEELESIFANFRAKMRAIPNKIASTLSGIVGETPAIQIQRQMEEFIDEALTELASKNLDEGQMAEPSEQA